jgi:hypothetical protein
MSRRLIVYALLLGGPAFADDGVVVTAEEEEDEDAIPDHGIGAEIGIAGGGRVTPGGLRVAGHFLYKLSEQDWFDGTAAFTFGAGSAECFRDRFDETICDHGFTQGRGVEAVASVRRYFAAQGQFMPFARAGVGIAIVRFSDDDVTGLAIPLHAGGGVRAGVADNIAVVAQAELVAGIGRYNRELGVEPVFGIAITAGAEFRLP